MAGKVIIVTPKSLSQTLQACVVLVGILQRHRCSHLTIL